MTSSTPEFDEVPAEDWTEQDLDADPLSEADDEPGRSSPDVDVLDLEADD